MESIIEIKGGIARQPQYRLAEELNLTIGKDEQIAIVGGNGAGKSALVGMLTGEYPMAKNTISYDFGDSPLSRASDNIKHIAFRDSYGDADGEYYYQQRWNSMGREEMPLVIDSLPSIEESPLKKSLFNIFRIDEMLQKQVILLSSGELRKFQITKVLLTNPRLVIMDNPFIGLDATTRGQLQELLAELSRSTNLQIILVFSKDDDIPSFVTHIIPMQKMICGKKLTREVYLATQPSAPERVLTPERERQILELPYSENLSMSESVVEFRKVSIRYGERTILRELDWHLRRGEKWALSGDNGAGKSTLLSLVCADNPQSYACDMSLFGRKRGTGESIWEIKRRIGYVSPEMHRAYQTTLPAIDVVASGHHDTTGLYKCMNKSELSSSLFWMEIFGIEGLKDRSFMRLSSGEQRLVLLARAFVKDPELLVLDEPYHGLDMRNRQLAKEVIETFSRREGKTMIMVTHYREELAETITHSIHLKRNHSKRETKFLKAQRGASRPPEAVVGAPNKK